MKAITVKYFPPTEKKDRHFKVSAPGVKSMRYVGYEFGDNNFKWVATDFAILCNWLDNLVLYGGSPDDTGDVQVFVFVPKADLK